MKVLVNFIQLMLVAAILYPVYYVWDTGRVENFCELIEKGMTVDTLNKIASDNNITLNSPGALGQHGGQWMTSVQTDTFFDDKACVIKGAVDKVANVELITVE
jgi:hypothetical protein